MGESLKDIRDKAMMLVGFAGGFRRSELVGLDVSDLEHVRQGIVITLRHSKTDQEGQGRKIGIPFGRTKHFPVKAIEMWQERALIVEGPQSFVPSADMATRPSRGFLVKLWRRWCGSG